MKKGFILTTCCAILVFAGAVPAMAQNQARSERVYIQDLEGIWMHDAYIDALKNWPQPSGTC